MHMADALVSPAVAGTMYACSAVVAGYSIKRVRLERDEKKIPVMGVMGAFVFAAQMINFSIPGTGSSGHLCGGMLLSAVLGPYEGFLAMIGVLLIQCLLFADGGLLALGCNIWNMAFYGCFIGAMVIWRWTMRKGMSKRKIIFASLIGCVLTLEMGAFSVTLETLASGITELPFALFAGTMLPIHAAIGLVEGLITSAVLVFLYDCRPELLYCHEKKESDGKWSVKKVVGVMAVLSLLVAGVLSFFASSLPDGLEWSLARITGSTEVSGGTDGIHAITGMIQSFTSLLPDYQIGGSEAGGGLAGLIGCGTVLLVCILVSSLIHRSHKKEHV